MKMTTTIAASNFAARVKLIKAAAQDAGTLEQIASAGAQVFEDEAQIKVPKLTGELSASIHQVTLQKTSAVARVAVVAYTPYALRTHWGHSGPTKTSHGRPVHQKAQPFLWAAWDEKKEAASEAMAAEAKSVIGKLLD